MGMTSGINALIVGNYLTTLGRSPAEDLQMLDDLKMPIGALSARSSEPAVTRIAARAAGGRLPERGGCQWEYDPPRFCPKCGRRLAVLVTPDGLEGPLSRPRRGGQRLNSTRCQTPLRTRAARSTSPPPRRP